MPRAGQLHLLAGLERLPRELGVAVDLGRVGRHLLLAEGAQGVAELPLDVGQGEGRVAHRPILAEPSDHARSELLSEVSAPRWRSSSSDSSTGAISGIQCDTFSSTSNVYGPCTHSAVASAAVRPNAASPVDQT